MKSAAARAVCVLRRKTMVGESPLWHSGQRRLYWIDVQGRKLHRFDPASGRDESFSLPEPITGLAFRKRGGLLLTLRKSLAFFDPDRRRLDRLARVEPRQPGNRFNDGKCDPGGNFWAGTMNATRWKAPSGHLFRVDPELDVRIRRSNVVCSNGCGWSPDGLTFYHTESFRYAVYAYDFDAGTGAISRRRVFARVDPRSGGFPDGMTVDREGGVWSCLVGLGRIVRYDPRGAIERQIELPVPRATACAFGGDKLDILYITSAREKMGPADLRRWPLSGSLFACRPGVRGLPAHVFAG
ncbi:MAG: SMP-30/gluconolactonase/LRE family protein [Opitutaceae bacterium]